MTKVKIILGFIALMLVTILPSILGDNGFTVVTENLLNFQLWT